MKAIEARREIAAPVETVFETMSTPSRFREAVTPIIDVEILSACQSGVGTKFRETRLMKGQRNSVVLEITEYVDNEQVRMVSDAGGSIWDTVFRVSKLDDPHSKTFGTLMEMRMEIRPKNLFARLMVPLIRGMVIRGVESDMDELKTYCESL
ncbi:MAG: SRPBCC family protein [Planctomycetota bacterium]